MTDKEIRLQIERATATVKTWPAWKRNILLHSLQPTNSNARDPVNNLKHSTNQPDRTGGDSVTSEPKGRHLDD